MFTEWDWPPFISHSISYAFFLFLSFFLVDENEWTKITKWINWNRNRTQELNWILINVLYLYRYLLSGYFMYFYSVFLRRRRRSISSTTMRHGQWNKWLYLIWRWVEWKPKKEIFFLLHFIFNRSKIVGTNFFVGFSWALVSIGFVNVTAYMWCDIECQCLLQIAHTKWISPKLSQCNIYPLIFYQLSAIRECDLNAH